MFCFFFVGPSQYSLFHTAEGMVQGPPDGLSGGETDHITYAPAYVLEHCVKRMRNAGAGVVRESDRRSQRQRMGMA